MTASARLDRRSPDARATELFAEALRLHAQGQLSRAEHVYRLVVELRPEHAGAWSNLALCFNSRGSFQDAAAAARRALAIRPDHPEAHINLLGALASARDTEGLVAACARARAALPHRPDLRPSFAAFLESVGACLEAGVIYLEDAIRDPRDALAHFQLGRMLSNIGKLEEAAASYLNAVTVAPAMAEAHSNMGTVLGTLGRFEEAAAAGRRACELAPDNAQIASNCGVVLQQSGRPREAAEAYLHAVGLNPRDAGAWANLGVAYQELFRFDDALSAFERALDARPGFDTASVELIKLRRHICDWSRFEDDRQQLFGFLDRESSAVFNLLLMGFDTSPEQQTRCAALHMRRLEAIAAQFPRPAVRRDGGPIRIGYLSTDYRDHPVGRLLPELFERHDRGRVRVAAYGLGTDDPGALRRRIVDACDDFVDLHGLSNAEAARRIAADGIDILVDLSGPTVGSRLEILAARPAPLQVSFLGWPGTMGASFIDYVIADPVLIPDHQRASYAEQVVHLPGCYQPGDNRRQPSPLPITRADCGLPDDGFVFCSFNNTTKLTPDVFALWMRILGRVPGSVLWLYCKTPRTRDHLLAEAARHGIACERIVFASVSHFDVYLSRLGLADLFLDSFPYNAGATCNDALFMGLPVLTRAGDTYVSRMAASMLTAVGLQELITTTGADYEAAAVRLATEPMILTGLRDRLAASRRASPFFDMARYARGLEDAFASMQARHLRGDPPGFIAVPDRHS